MLCNECGSQTNLVIEDRPSFDFPEVTIVNSHVYVCPSCGNELIAAPALREKVKLLASMILMKPSRLSGFEIRYLRVLMRWTGREMAEYLGVRVEAVSRWENGHSLMATSADKLLRVLAAPAAGVARDDMHSHLTEVAVKAPQPLRGEIEFVDKSWRQVSEAREGKVA